MDGEKSPSQLDFDRAAEYVEGAIRKLGLDPAAVKVRPHTAPGTELHDRQVAWTLKRGSASVLVTVTHRDHEKATYLRTAAPVIVLPADAGKHLALFRHILELNASGLANAAFGLAGDKVIAVSERPAAGLGPEEVEQCIRHLAAVADTFDDKLAKEFGAIRPPT
jgi:hypothetical protein